MTDFGSVDAIQEAFILKLHDLDLWYNATIFNCVSGLIRVQSVQFPLFIKESLQGKLRLKNKTISIIECLYDTKKNTFLPLKIELDINLEYKTGKSHLKRFLINVNDFKVTSNKSERIRTLKSVQRIFSVEAIFKLVERVENENSLTSSVFKNQSRSGLKGYNSPSSKGGYSNHNIGQNRFPRTEIFNKKSPNSKGIHIKSPKKLSQFQSIEKERYQQDTNPNEEARRSQTYKSSEVSSSPSNQQKYGYQFAAYDVLRSQNSTGHQQGQDPFQEESRDLQSKKLYATYQENLSSKEEHSVKGEDAQNMTEMLLEEIKNLRKKLSEVLGQKNNLYLEREKSLLQFESLDKEQKIRHKRELAQQKAYYESLLLQKDSQIQQLNIRLSQIPTEIRYIENVENQNIEHPNPQIRSLMKGDPINLKANPSQSKVSSSPQNKKIRLSQHFQLTSSGPLQLQGNTQKSENAGSKQSATQQKQKSSPFQNDLQSLSEIYNERQAIEGLKRDLEAKNQEIKELRQLANEQDMELTKIKSLIEQITSAAQENQDLYSSPFPEHPADDRESHQSNDGNAAIEENPDKPSTPKQQYSFSNNGSKRINLKESGNKITQNQFEELITKLASDIHFLEAKVKELESTNKVYSEEHNQKLIQLKNAQDEIKKTTQQVSELKKLNQSLKVQIDSLKQKVQQDKIELQRKEDFLQQYISGPQSQKRKPRIIRVNQKNQPNGIENLYDAQNQNQLSGIVEKLEQNIQTIENDISVLNDEQTQIKKLLQQTNPRQESDFQTHQKKERTKSSNQVQSPSQQYLKNFNIEEMNPPQNNMNQNETSNLKENQKQTNRNLVHEQNEVYLKSKNQEASLDSKRMEEPRNRNPSATKSLTDSKEKAPKASSMSKRNYRTTKDERKRKRLSQDDECCSGCC